ncbi:hypothetical protein HGRIS_007456 [Hohenbuehelia grisea]|uniref:GH16 domain-containing protein n=1 Tax=Hohenbuehelia grisea TaxID=104357 RepID=A0ABR3J4W2_9AGAR
MHYPKALPLCLLLLISDASASFSPRSMMERAHKVALKHSRGLARDLRVAFGGAVVDERAQKGRRLIKRGEYCVAGPKAGLSGAHSGGGGAGVGGSVGSNGTSPASGSRPSATRGSTTTRTGTGAGASPTSASSPWTLVEEHSGSDFYNGWDFFIGADPTNGIVTYVDEGTGRNAGLLNVNSAGNALMRVETTPNVPNTRQSIRITTKSLFDGGLFVMDSIHMPTGCGTWPAFWTNGPNWPSGGEIDIVEGVHDYTNNQMTIHTDPGCRLSTTDAGSLKISGAVIGGQDCAAASTGNQGCGIRASASNSFGAAFNRNGGGVYAMQWDSTGVAVYFFPRDAIPADLTSNAPQPSSWGAPQARWPASGCNPFEFFKQHHVIFDTTLCGDWAAGVWSSAGVPGQDQSCAQRTGYPTCEAFVRANGASFNEAFWEVQYVKIFQEKQ